MERDDFLKLMATGATTIVIGVSACGNSNKEKEEKALNAKTTKTSADNKRLEKSNVEDQLVFSSMADLKKADPTSSEINIDSQIQLLGYYEPNDGGGGIFYWDKDATEADNKGTVIKPQSDRFEKTGRWKRYIEEDIINVKAFGAKGDGSGVDDQPAIQAAIDSLSDGDTLLIPDGDYTVELNDDSTHLRPSAIVLRSNMEISMSENTIIRLPDTEEATEYNVFALVDVEDIKISGGTVTGNKNTSTETSGAHGFGIGVFSSKNITIENTTYREHWGDGIYIGTVGGTESKCQDITIRRVVCDNNRRQGMSVISVDGLYVEGSTFKNTGGHAPGPGAGIDFEPNNNSEVLHNITLDNVRVHKNRGAGVFLQLSRIGPHSGASVPATVDVTINSLHSFMNAYGIQIRGYGSEGYGAVNINDLYSEEEDKGGIAVTDWAFAGPKVIIENPTIINPCRGGRTSNIYSPIAIRRLNDRYPEVTETGNVLIRGSRIRFGSGFSNPTGEDLAIVDLEGGTPKVYIEGSHKQLRISEDTKKFLYGEVQIDGEQVVFNPTN